MKKNKLDIFIILIIFVLGFVSCSEPQQQKQNDTVVSKVFENEEWDYYPLEASYMVENAPLVADLVMEVDVTDVFPNVIPHPDDTGELEIDLTVESPEGNRRTLNRKFPLKDREGNFKAEKVDGCYHYEFSLINDRKFDEKGEYRFKIENKYSKIPLCGIKKLEIKCLRKDK